MIRFRTRKILSDIWARKVRTLLAAASIFIGVFGVVSLTSAGEILVNQLQKDLQQDRLAMLQSNLILSRGAEVDNAAVLENLRQQPGVTAVEARAVYPLFWRLEDEDNFREGSIAAHSEPIAESQIEPPRLDEGRWPESTGTSERVEIAIERRMAEEFDLGLGDTIVIRALGAGSQNSETVTATGEIVGILFQPYSYSGFGTLVEPDKLVVTTYDDARYLAGFRGFSVLYARFEDYATAEAEEQAFLATVGETAYTPTFTQIEDPEQNPQIESVRSTNRLLVILALVALVVSGFLIVNLINSIVVEQKRQIGLLKSLGASTSDNLYIYIGIAFTYGLMGVIPGVLLGLPAGYVFAQGLAIQSQTVIEEFSVSATGLIAGVLIGLAVPVLAAVIPVLLGIRVSILSAMTDFGIGSNFGKSRLDRLVGGLPLPTSLRQAVRNAYQKKFRLALTGITLLLASAAFMGIFAVFSSLTALVNNAFNTFQSEISITPNEGQDFEQVRELLTTNVDGVASVDPASSLAISIEGYDPGPVQAGPPGLFATGFNTENPGLLDFEFVSGNGWEDDPERSGVVISSLLSESLGKSTGDEIVMLGGGNRQTFEIIGVADFPTDSVWMNWRELAEFGGIVDAEGNPYPNAFDVVLASDEPTSRQVDDTINEVNEVLLANGISARFVNQVELAELITTIVASVGVILGLAAFLIALVGAVGLLTTLSMSVFERQKEIGVMRSVGAGSGAVALQFLTEGIIVGVVSWIVAAPVSYFFSRGLITILPFGGNYELGYPPTALLVGFVGMLGLVTVASLLPSLAAARKTVSDILRYQ